MPVRRVRTEQLTLYPTAGGVPLVLSAESREPGDLATQDVFQVSPDGGYVAYAAYGSLRVRAADGTEQKIAGYGLSSQMRFSADGQYLAAVVQGEHVLVLELATGAIRELGELSAISQLEWFRGGLVVDAGGQLVALPLAGDRATLVDKGVERFAAAAAGTRVVAFVREPSGMRIVATDATAPSRAHDLGTVADTVTNAAASLEGDRVAFTTLAALFTITGDGRPQAIGDSYIHSVWFARDGRLGYASETGVTIVGGAAAHRVEGDGPYRMLRFDTLSASALAVTSAHVWDVAPDVPRVVATPPRGREVLGADRFAGGVVLWTTAR